MLLVDDHPIVRQGLREILEHSSGFRVVGEVGDGAESVKAAVKLVPDVVIMDVLMPNMDGAEACREIMSALPETRVLILTASTEEEGGHQRRCRRCYRLSAEVHRERRLPWRPFAR